MRGSRLLPRFFLDSEDYPDPGRHDIYLEIFSMYTLRRLLPILLTLPSLAAYAQVIPPSGDTTGKTDGAAINSALSSGLSAQLACNAHYYTNVPLQVVASARFVGCGINTTISGVGTISGGIVEVLSSGNNNNAGQLVGNFQIVGGTATYAVLAGSQTQDVGPSASVHLFNIWVSAGTYTDVFWFNTFFNNEVDNLLANGSMTVSAACFHMDGQVNANTFNTMLADCGAPYGFYMESDNETSGSTGNTFNGLTAEGGCSSGTSATCAGLYVGAGFAAETFNGFYTENVLHPIVLGNATASKVCASLTFNSPVIGGPYVVNSSQVALVDVDDCAGATFNSPNLGIYGIASAAPLTFSGGGCSTEPTAIAIPSPAGVVVATTLTYPGVGCASAPTVVIGGAGTGAIITAAESGGVVTGLTIGNGGTGYKLPNGGSIVPFVYNIANKTVVIGPVCPDGANGYGSPCWAYLVRAPGADNGTGIQFIGDAFYTPGYGFSNPADLKFTGRGNQYYISYVNGQGATQTLSVVPQVYP